MNENEINLRLSELSAFLTWAEEYGRNGAEREYVDSRRKQWEAERDQLCERKVEIEEGR